MRFNRGTIPAALILGFSLFMSHGAFAESGASSAGYHSDSHCVDKAYGVKLFRQMEPLQSNKTYRVAVVLKHSDAAYWQQLRRGAQAAAHDYNAKLVIKAAAGDNAGKQQLSALQGLAGQSFDAYVVAPESTSNLRPALRQIRHQRVPIVNIGDARIAATTFVGPDYELEGNNAAMALSKRLEPRSQTVKLLFPQHARVAQVEGDLALDATLDRTRGFERHVGRAGHLTLLESATGGGDMKTAYDVTETLLREHPDLKGIYADDDQMALAAAEAVNASGRDIAVVGTGSSPNTIRAVRDGVLAATVSSLPYYQGYWAVEAAVRLAAGEHLPGWIVAPAQIISTHNVNVFYDDNGQIRPGLYR